MKRASWIALGLIATGVSVLAVYFLSPSFRGGQTISAAALPSGVAVRRHEGGLLEYKYDAWTLVLDEVDRVAWIEDSMRNRFFPQGSRHSNGMRGVIVACTLTDRWCLGSFNDSQGITQAFAFDMQSGEHWVGTDVGQALSLAGASVDIDRACKVLKATGLQ